MNDDAGGKPQGDGEQRAHPAWDSLAVRESIVGIRQRFNYLTELWLAGELEAARYLGELSAMVYFDPAGDCWYISPANGNWYRVTAEGQAPGEPPMFLYRPVDDLVDNAGADKAPLSTANYCAYCGSPALEGAGFCSRCGRTLQF